jgi:hypothetical protein
VKALTWYHLGGIAMVNAQRCLQSRHRRDATARNTRPRMSDPHALYTSQQMLHSPCYVTILPFTEERSRMCVGLYPRSLHTPLIRVRALHLPAPPVSTCGLEAVARANDEATTAVTVTCGRRMVDLKRLGRVLPCRRLCSLSASFIRQSRTCFASRIGL